MKRRLLVLCSAALWLTAVSTLSAQNPFTVTPSMEATDGGALVHVRFAVPANHFLYADKLSLVLIGAGGTNTFALPEPLTISDRSSNHTKRAYGKEFDATCRLSEVPHRPFQLQVAYQGCDDGRCFFPQEASYRIMPDGRVTELTDDAAGGPLPEEWRSLAANFNVVARGSGYLGETDFLKFLNRTQNRLAATESALAWSGGSWEAATSMLLILLGGLALNLTPCILPLIPINLAIIGAGAQASSKKRGFALGTTYGAGMALAYGVLGLAVVLTGSKFGTLNSSAWFNVAIAVIFVVLALAMFDRIHIDFSRFQGSSGGRPAGGGGKFAVAFTMGVVAALLAGACVAPVVISVLLQATAFYNQGIKLGLALPFLLGLGMALPWPFAGAGLSFLPRPGRWMTRVKHGFGVIILAFAGYYGYLAYELSPGNGRVTSLAAGHAGSSATTEAEVLNEELARALARARADGKPVFIDFWASWCKNCVAMEKTTFKSKLVRQNMEQYLQVRIQAERPNDPATRAILDHFGALGLPTYVVLVPKPPAPSVTAAAEKSEAKF